MRACRFVSLAFLITVSLISHIFASSAISTPSVVIKENEAIFKDDDPRLSKTISLEAEGATIASVLSQLSESTGVIMNAGIDKDDWMVQDRKVIVYVKDMKLRDLMQELASVLRFHWSRGGEKGNYTYRLWQDKLQRNEEESLRNAALDEETRKYREKRENALADLANLGSLSTSDALALKEKNPWLYVIATEPLGKDVASFMNSFAEARNAFVQGIEASFPVSQLRPDLQEMVRRIAVSYDSLMHSIGVSEDHKQLLNNFEKLQISINRNLHTNNELIKRNILGQITISSSQASMELPIFEPSSGIARAIGKAIVSLKSGMSKEDVGKQLQQDMISLANDVQKFGNESRESTRDITSDPALKKKIRLFNTDTIAILPMTLRALAKESGLNIISDYFIGAKPLITSSEKPLGEHLEDIRKLYGSNWEKVGQTIRFRDREWFRKRAWEIPQVWIDYWLAMGDKDGLKLEELAQIANLRDEQIDNTVINHRELVGLGAGEAARNRQILRFYASLNNEQKKALKSQGLNVSLLDDSQWLLLQKALATKGAVYAATAKNSQLVQLIQSDTEYKISFWPRGNEQPVTFKITYGIVYKTEDQLDIPKRPRE